MQAHKMRDALRPLLRGNACTLKEMLIGPGAGFGLAPPGGDCLPRRCYLGCLAWLGLPKLLRGFQEYLHDLMSSARQRRLTREWNTDSGAPSLSPCLRRQSLLLHHIPYPTKEPSPTTASSWPPLAQTSPFGPTDGELSRLFTEHERSDYRN